VNGTYLWPFTMGCFLLTYVAHSTILILGVSTLIRWTKPTRPQVRKLLWRVALCGGVVTSVIQTAVPLPHWGAQITLVMQEPIKGEEESASTATDMRAHDRRSLESTPTLEQSAPARGVTGTVRKQIEPATASSELRGIVLRTWAVAAAKLLVCLCLAGSACVRYALLRQHIALRRLVSNSRQITRGPLSRLVHLLGPRQEVTLEIRGGERNRFVITELTQEQRNLATAH